MRNRSCVQVAARLCGTVLALTLAGFSGQSLANRADLDLAFGVDGVVRLAVSNGGFNDLVTQPDGKIVAVGMSGSDWLIARFNTDGSLDPGFGNGGVRTVTPPPTTIPPEAKAVALDASGRALVAGGRYVMRFTTGGNLDAGYGTGGVYAPPLSPSQQGLLISDIMVASDGGFLLSCGVFGFVPPSYSAQHISALKLTSAGVVDTSFGTGGYATKFGGLDRIYNETHAIAEWNGNVYVAGRVGSRTFVYRAELVRFTSTGQVDTTFGTDGAMDPVGSTALVPNGRVTELALQSSGLVVAGAGMTSSSFQQATRTARINAAGLIDPSFQQAEILNTQDPLVSGLMIDSDSRVVLGTTTTTTPIVASFLPGGATDTGFGVAGTRTAPFDGQPVTSMTLQADGKYLLAGGVGSSVAYVARLRGTAVIPPEVNTTPAAGTLLSASGGLPGTTQSLGAIQFTNRGSDALIISGCTASSGFSAVAAFPLTITQGAPQSVAVSCQMPSAPLTMRNGTLVCNTNDADEPQLNFPLQCTSGAGAPGASAIPALGQGMQWLLGALVALIALVSMRGARRHAR